jgi:hypothetical protein
VFAPATGTRSSPSCCSPRSRGAAITAGLR